MKVVDLIDIYLQLNFQLFWRSLSFVLLGQSLGRGKIMKFGNMCGPHRSVA
uniref:Uncharacterized protein n=1 Tax=Arundo donax TaxID=35708 RepID=A0A0A9BTJ2_ARUDO